MFPIQISNEFIKQFGLHYSPVGFYWSDNLPEDSLPGDKSFNGCIAPLIFQAAKGKTIALNKTNLSRNCAAFYLGLQEWIRPGIEHFLSQGTPEDPRNEKFISNSDLAKEFLESQISEKISNKTAVFKPLVEFSGNEKPEFVIFFVNPDQLSGLIFLAHFENPLSTDRIVTRFSSACGSIFTTPYKFALNKEKKGVFGLHDISTRTKFPADVLSLALTYPLVEEMFGYFGKSFLTTEAWQSVKERIIKQEKKNEK